MYPGHVADESVFEVEELTEEEEEGLRCNSNSHSLPKGLRATAQHVSNSVLRMYGKKQLITRLVIDFEACIDLSKQQQQLQTDLKARVVAGAAAAALENNSRSQIPPHHLNGHIDSTTTSCPVVHYRVVQIKEIAFAADCIAVMRRDAVLEVSPDMSLLSHFRNFHMHFKREWMRLEDEVRNREIMRELDGVKDRLLKEIGRTRRRTYSRHGDSINNSISSSISSSSSSSIAVMNDRKMKQQQQQQQWKGSHQSHIEGSSKAAAELAQKLFARRDDGDGDDESVDDAVVLAGGYGVREKKYRDEDGDGGDHDDDDSDDSDGTSVEVANEAIDSFDSDALPIREDIPLGIVECEQTVFQFAHRQQSGDTNNNNNNNNNSGSIHPLSTPSCCCADDPAAPIDPALSGVSDASIAISAVYRSSSSRSRSRSMRSRRRADEKEGVSRDKKILNDFRSALVDSAERERRRLLELELLQQQAASIAAKRQAEQEERKRQLMLSGNFRNTDFKKRASPTSAAIVAIAESPSPAAMMMTMITPTAAAAGVVVHDLTDADTKPIDNTSMLIDGGGGDGDDDDDGNAIATGRSSSMVMAAASKREMKKRAMMMALEAKEEEANAFRAMMDKAADEFVSQMKKTSEDSCSYSSYNNSYSSSNKGRPQQPFEGKQPISMDDRDFDAKSIYLVNHSDQPTTKRRSHAPSSLAEDFVCKQQQQRRRQQSDSKNEDGDDDALPDMYRGLGSDRNDAEYDEKAYRIAARIDPSFLISRFDSSKHCRGKTLVIDDDDDDGDFPSSAFSLPTAIALPEVKLPVLLSAEERAMLRRERRLAAKREKTRKQRQLRGGANVMLSQLIGSLPKKLQAKLESLFPETVTSASRAVSSRMDVRVDMLSVQSSNSSTTSSSDDDGDGDDGDDQEEEEEEEEGMPHRRNTLIRLKRKKLKKQQQFGTLTQAAATAALVDADHDQHDDDDDDDEVRSVLNRIIEQIATKGDVPGTEENHHHHHHDHNHRMRSGLSLPVSRGSTPSDSDYMRALLNPRIASATSDTHADNATTTVPCSSSSRASTAASDKSNRNALTSSRGSTTLSAHRRTRDSVGSRESSQRVMSLLNLTKVMMDGSIIVDSFNIFESVAGASALHDVSCILQAASPGPSHPLSPEGGGRRLSTPIFSVRVVATPRTPSSAHNTSSSSHQHHNHRPSSAALDISHDPHSDFEIVRVDSCGLDPSSFREHYDSAVRRMPYAYRPVPPEGSLWGEFCGDGDSNGDGNGDSGDDFPLFKAGPMEGAIPDSSLCDSSSSTGDVLLPTVHGSEEEGSSSSALVFPSIEIKSLVVGLQQYSSAAVDSTADTLISSRQRFPKMDDRSGLFPVSPRTKKALTSLQQCFDRSRRSRKKGGFPQPSTASEAKKAFPGESKPPRIINAQKAAVRVVSPVPPPSPPPPTPSSKGLYIIAQNIQKIASAQSSRGTDEHSST